MVDASLQALTNKLSDRPLPCSSATPPVCSCARPVGGRIFFAGEHTRADHPAETTGAYLSGDKAACDLLKAAAAAAGSSAAVQAAAKACKAI